MAAFRLYRKGTAECVEAEDRIRARYEGDVRDRRFGNEVPVNGVPERFVDAYAVDIDRKTFGRAEQWRGGEPVIVDVHLIRVVGALAGIDASEIVIEIVPQIERLLTQHVLAVAGLYIRRHFIQGQTQAGQRCGADHNDLLHLSSGSRIDWTCVRIAGPREGGRYCARRR